jgi:outer membrane immunogenic protein
MNFGSKTVVLPDTTIVNLKQDFNQVKIGVNYHFGKDEAVAGSAMPVKAAPAAVFNWTGVYVGAAVASRSSVESWATNLIGDEAGGLMPADPTTTPASFFSSNAQGRLYAGYNWQLSPNWVAGIEGDVGNGDSSMTVAGIPGTFGNGSQSPVGIEAQLHDSASVKMGWDGTIRGKLGMLITPTILFYGTGGAAFQQVRVSAVCDGDLDSFCTTGNARNQSFSSVRAGWTLGLGIEAVLTGNWIGKAEVRYADFGRYNNTFFAGTGDDVVTSVRVQTLTALAGVSYKFGPTAVVAKY